jgi:L-threonylcarbamoyladenylate synthase
VSGHRFLTVSQAANYLQDGAVVAYPTEAVYGLGCDPRNEAAVRRVLKLKNRPAEAGLILIADTFERLQPFARPVNEELMERAMSAWPGPVTWLFPRASEVPDWLAGQHETVAVRLTDHPVSRALCRAFGGALVSTSANPAQAEPARSVSQLDRYFGSSIAGVVEGDLGGDDSPSEIRDLATGRVLREG